MADIADSLFDTVQGELSTSSTVDGVEGDVEGDVEGIVEDGVDGAESEVDDDVESEVEDEVDGAESEVEGDVKTKCETIEENMDIPSILPTSTITAAMGDIGDMLDGDTTTADGTVIPKDVMVKTACIIFGDFVATFIAFAVATNIVMFGKQFLDYDSDDLEKTNLIVIGVDAGFYLLTGCITDFFHGYSKSLHVYGLICFVGTCILPLVTFNWSMFGPSYGISIPIRRIFFYMARFVTGFGVCGIQATSPPFAARQIEKYSSSSVQSVFHYIYMAVIFAPLLAYTGVSFVQLNVSFFVGYLSTVAVNIFAMLFFKFIKGNFRESIPDSGKAVVLILSTSLDHIKNKLSTCSSCCNCDCCSNYCPSTQSIDEESLELLKCSDSSSTPANDASMDNASSDINPATEPSGSTSSNNTICNKDLQSMASTSESTELTKISSISETATSKLGNTLSSPATKLSSYGSTEVTKVSSTAESATTLAKTSSKPATFGSTELTKIASMTEVAVSTQKTPSTSATSGSTELTITSSITETVTRKAKTQSKSSSAANPSGSTQKNMPCGADPGTKAPTSEIMEIVPESVRHVCWVLYAMLLLSCQVPYSIMRYQISTSYVSQAVRMKPSIIGYSVSSSLLQECLPLVGLIFAPIVNIYIYPYISTKFTTLTMPNRTMVGIALATASVFSAAIVETARLTFIDRGDYFVQEINNQTVVASTLSIAALLPQYLFMGAADVFIYITSLEFAFRQSPCTMQVIATGIFLFYEAIGRIAAILLVPWINTLTAADPWYPKDINDGHLNYYFLVLTAISLTSLIIYCLLEKGYEEVDQYLCPDEETYGGVTSGSSTTCATVTTSTLISTNPPAAETGKSGTPSATTN